MSSIIGKNIIISIFGESHSSAIGVTIDGIPAGISIDMAELIKFLGRRSPGKTSLTSSRKEADIPSFISGIKDGITCGTPITAIIYNQDINRSDYNIISDRPRPGHADYTSHIKYKGFEDFSGGGHNSGRLTAPLCVAGGILIQALSKIGIEIFTEIVEIGGKNNKFDEAIEKAVKSKDSVGGIVRCVVKGVPAGYGDPIFDGIENQISKIIFGIPAVKGIEFGAGFESTRLKGSEMNDEFYYDENDEVRTKTNNAGGILGGITTGMDIIFQVAIKPTPSIALRQNTIEYKSKENTIIEIKGRHDPCIVPRVLPCIEAGVAIVIADFMREKIANHS